METFLLTPQEIVGFFVGEGSFTVESGYDTKYLLGWRIRPYISIAIRKDDEKILYAIQKVLGCGHIYELDFGRYQKYKSKGWKPQVKWKVSNINDLWTKVVPFFNRYPPFGTKKLAFDVFRQLVERKYNHRDRHVDSLPEIKHLAHTLQLINKRGL